MQDTGFLWLGAGLVDLPWLKPAPAILPRPRRRGTVVILAGGADAARVAEVLARRRFGLVVGVVCVNGAADGGRWPPITVAALGAVLREGGVRDVVFAGETHGALAAVFSDVFGSPARVWLALDFSGMFSGALPARWGMVPVLGEYRLSAGQPVKRLFDILLGFAIFLPLLPVMGAIALALRLSGTKRVLFRQTRIGAGGRPFDVLKFRTMVEDEGAAFLQALPGDKRVTPLGRWLRRTSLDELPQLVNVIRGEMSLVGPRPHAPATSVAGVRFEDAARFYRLRYRAKPGMTGLAQIRGQRGATGDLDALERRVTSDLEYIETWTPWLDVLILLRTLPAMVRACNAY